MTQLKAEDVPAGATSEFVGGDGVLFDHVGCRGCGYDLMGLRADGGCPECGKAVGESVAEAVRLAAAKRRVVDAGWWGQVESGACIVGGTAFLRLVFMINGGKPSPDMCVAMLFLAVIAGFGWRILTKPRPGFEKVEEINQGRVRARWAAVTAEFGVAVVWMPALALAPTGAGRVVVVAFAAVFIAAAATMVKQYWPLAIGTGFAQHQTSWDLCYWGVMGALCAAVVAMGISQVLPTPGGWGLAAAATVGGGCYLYALALMCLAGKQAEEGRGGKV